MKLWILLPLNHLPFPFSVLLVSFWTCQWGCSWAILLKWIFIYQCAKSIHSGTQNKYMYKECLRKLYVYPNTVMKWWSLVFPFPLGLTCSPWDVISLRERCALGVLCLDEGDSGSLSRTDHIFLLSFPRLLRSSCWETCHLEAGRRLLANTGKQLVPCTSYVAHKCRSWEIWALIKNGFNL